MAEGLGRRIRAIANVGGPRTPAVRQGEHAECGLAALAILMGHHGVHIPVSELRAQGGSTLLGSSLRGLRELARRNGFAASAHRAEPEGLIRLGLPLIVHYRFMHFVVVEAIRPETVRLNDPLCGATTVPSAVFAEDFTGFALRLERLADTPARGRPFSALARYGAYLGPAALWLGSGALAVSLGAVSLAAGAAVLATAAGTASPRLVPIGAWLVAAGLAIDAAVRHTVPLVLARRARAMAVVGADEIASLPRHVVLGRGPQPVRRRLMGPLALADDGPVLGAYAALSWMMMTIAAPLVSPGAGLVQAAAQAAQLALLLAVTARRGGAIRLFGVSDMPIGRLGTATYANPDPWKVGDRGEALFRRAAGLHARAAAGVLRAAVDRIRVDGVLHAVDLAKAILLGRLLIQAQDAATASAALALIALAGLASLDLVRIRQGLHVAGIEDALHAVADWPDGTSRPDSSPGDREGLVLRHVSWRPASLFDPVVRNIDAAVGPGAILAIGGAAGSGRTTLARLAAGWLAPSSGQATFGGIATTLLPDGTAILLDGVVPLETGTLREVLRFGAPIADRDIAAALAAVGLADLVASRGGLDQRLDRDRPGFSGGELARFGLARALCRRPRLLVLDGTLDAVEADLAEVIARRIAGRGIALVLVSNRRETLAVADSILDLPARDQGSR